LARPPPTSFVGESAGTPWLSVDSAARARSDRGMRGRRCCGPFVRSAKIWPLRSLRLSKRSAAMTQRRYNALSGGDGSSPRVGASDVHLPSGRRDLNPRPQRPERFPRVISSLFIVCQNMLLTCSGECFGTAWLAVIFCCFSASCVQRVSKWTPHELSWPLTLFPRLAQVCCVQHDAI
jgi:hypothetical protein